MASPESQGKTIALVITIVLFVAASGTAFYFFDKVKGAEEAQLAATRKASETDTNLKKVESSYADLRRMVTGQPGSTAEHEKTITDINQVLVNEAKDPVRKKKDLAQRQPAFSNLVEGLKTTYGYLKAADQETLAIEENLAKQTNQLAGVSKVYQSKVDTADEATSKKAAEVKEQQENFNKTLEERGSAVDAAQLRFQKLSAEHGQLKRNTEAQIEDLRNEITKMTLLMERARQRQIRGQDVRFNLEDGEIVQLQGGGSEAYINVGRADGAIEGLTFGIYGIDRAGFVQNLPKANLEIIRVLADKRSLARVLDYQIVDPVVPGDKIFNPIWDQGRKTGVALLGIVDMDGDGTTDNDEFKRLVERWGGKIDAEVDLKTYKVVGRITTETDWLVEGKIPEPADAGEVEAGDTQNIRNAILAGTTKMRKDAQVNGVRPVNVHNFLAYMGHRAVRKTQLPGEEDIYRKTIQDQRTRRIQPNPGDVSQDDEGIDPERVKRDAARKAGKKDAAKTTTKAKKDADADFDEGEKKPAKKDKKKTDEDAGMDEGEKKPPKKENKKKDDDFE
jgi:hypothetical protein